MSDVDAARGAEPVPKSTRWRTTARLWSRATASLLIVENDENFARFLVDMAHENGLQGRRRLAGRRGALAGSRPLARRRDHARHPAARHRRVARARAPQERSRAPGTSPSRSSRPRRTPAARFALGASASCRSRSRAGRRSTSTFADDPEVRSTEAGSGAPRLLSRTEIRAAAHRGGRAATACGSARRVAGRGAGRARRRRRSTASSSMPRRCRRRRSSRSREILRQCGDPRASPSSLYAAGRASDRAPMRDRLERVYRSAGGPPRALLRAAPRPGSAASCTGRCRRFPEAARAASKRSTRPTGCSPGKKVLIVDDDIRNIFAMTSVLERQNMDVISAETGKEAIEKLADDARRRHRPDGHHDAGHGRLRHDAGHPQASTGSRTCRSSPSRPRP